MSLEKIFPFCAAKLHHSVNQTKTHALSITYYFYLQDTHFLSMTEKS